MVELLPYKCKALCSVPSTTKTKQITPGLKQTSYLSLLSRWDASQAQTSIPTPLTDSQGS